MCSTFQWTNQNIKRVISFPSYSTSTYINKWFYKINMTFKLKETHLYPLKINKIDSKAKQFIPKIYIYPIPNNTSTIL